MTVEPGQIVLHYRLIEKIGEGGMGLVWKAVDTSLDREVAIKILPDVFAADPDRLARFEREAKLLASLSHPNIAVVHGLHEESGMRFLAMELLAGEDLSHRLARGPMPLDEALPVARDVAEALEAAHDNGVIHRDLKPANIQLTPGGAAKVLDFGLAKAFEPSAASGSGDMSASPTLTSAGTVAGMLLGTAAYMSPEQARGQPVDKRCDMWAFGCVLFEMLTGRKTFAGGTVSDTIAGILRGEPDWSQLPPDTPRRVRDLIQRCLEKDARQRLRDIGDARIELTRVVRDQSSPRLAASPDLVESPPASRSVLPLAATLAAGLLLGAAAWHWLGPAGSTNGSTSGAEVSRVSITVPADQQVSDVQISADGRRVAYIASGTGADGESQQLYVRSLDSFEATPIPKSERVTWARFSPDGRWLAYAAMDETLAKGEIRKIALDGGPPVALVKDYEPGSRWMEANWGADDSLLFPWEGNLARVSTNGGKPEVLLDPDAGGEPSVVLGADHLPDENRLLVSVGYIADGGLESRTEVLSLDSGERRVLLERGGLIRWIPTGHLLFSRDDTLFAVPFDPHGVELKGPELALLSGIDEGDLSENGTLVYTVESSETKRLAWVDRQGSVSRIERFDSALPEGGAPMDLRWSPDGEQLAVSVFDPSGNRGRMWIYEPRRSAPAPFDFPGGFVNVPVWSPDSTRLTFSAGSSEGGWRMHRRAAGSSGTPVALFEDDDPKAGHWPEEETPDGSLLVVTRALEGDVDLWVVPTEGEGRAGPLIATPAREEDARISRDGRWIAYESNQSGRSEIWVSPMSSAGDGPVERRTRVSIKGGERPCWSADDKELFFVQAGRLMAASVEPGDGDGLPSFGPPRPLLDLEALGLQLPYDVHPVDGRFVFAHREQPDGESREIQVVFNWFEELKRRASN